MDVMKKVKIYNLLKNMLETEHVLHDHEVKQGFIDLEGVTGEYTFQDENLFRVVFDEDLQITEVFTTRVRVDMTHYTMCFNPRDAVGTTHKVKNLNRYEKRDLLMEVYLALMERRVIGFNNMRSFMCAHEVDGPSSMSIFGFPERIPYELTTTRDDINLEV